MAMQPIDLQVLFSQLENVSKEVNAQKDGLALRGAMNASQSEKRTEEKSHSVKETHDTSDGLEALNAHQKQNSKEKNENKNNHDEETGGGKHRPFFQDPSLGNYIDLSG